MIPRYLVACFVALLCLPAFLVAQEKGKSGLRKENPPIVVEEIIRKFAEKEQEFQRARENYIYRQTVRIEVLELDGRRSGEEYFMVSDILFDNKGRRLEKVVRSPPSTLQRVILTPEDLHDIQNIFPFVLTTSNVGKYNLTYLGKEKIDEIDSYVFDVSPKKVEKDERYFEGKIWVDDQDLQIVKTDGKTIYVVTKKNKDARFPRFETYRNNIDGKYWFPVYTKADDVLDFPGNKVRIREVVKYENYKRFEADVKITNVEEVPAEKPKPSP
ncbi:MAG: hypothetical protein L0387_01460 [Acidobacteria bacterium]|nr:hypothetical protein [Acidobacteriota bacterium]MCI0723183.1 hypothetical protein [Acidobacteriota bacterium]